ncbi:MAG: hypothetical protein FJY92_01465, partial [Candidatus Hydrogenedentes bacterium]|nr:hypothetical protein [Candidatus Hydrogenedentota bacterium]
AVSVWKYANVRRTAAAAVALAGVATLCIVLAPDATLTKAANTFTAFDAGGSLRLWFWAGTWDMIKEHPITGVGLGRYAIEGPQHLANVLWAPGGERFMHDTLLTEHPHNDFLLVWAEAGVLGGALVVWALVGLLRSGGPEWGGLAAWLVFALFNSPLHSPPHALAAFLLGACLIERRAPKMPFSTAFGNWGGRFLGVLVLAMPLPVWFGLVVPSYRLQQAQTAHVEGRSALALYSDAAETGSIIQAEIDEKYGIALLDVRDYESARDRFKKALDGSDSGSVYLGLGTAEYLLGNNAAAYAALEKAVYRWPSHLDAWRLLLRTCPTSEREDWLIKAKRFLRASELDELRNGPAAGTPAPGAK